MISALEEIGFYTLSDYRAANSSASSQMKRCEIIITEYCNFKCPYCQGLSDFIYDDRRLKQLSFDEIKNTIDYWCEPLPLENIRFSGGEPTLHKYIIEIVSYAKTKGIKRIAISTNGSNKLEKYLELIDAGCNDFSISLDACCASDGDKMAGGIAGAWEKVISNIKELSRLTYVTVGVVLTEDNVGSIVQTIEFAHDLGVADIRIISAAQWNQSLPELEKIRKEILDNHPILKYRVNRLLAGYGVRGISKGDSNKCGLVLDDSIVAGRFHFPCVIYMREGGKPIGEVGPNMRQKRLAWYKEHDTHTDPICWKNCLDVCVDYCNKFSEKNPLSHERANP